MKQYLLLALAVAIPSFILGVIVIDVTSPRMWHDPASQLVFVGLLTFGLPLSVVVGLKAYRSFSR